jgi:hypothetical protein
MQGMLSRGARVVVFGVLMLPSAALADAPARRDPDLVRARELRAAAEALFESPREWRKVARLMEASASMRPADDVEAYECLRYAANVRAALGEHRHSRRLLARAAEHALARGAVLDAADAYLAAAVSAAEQQKAGEATRYAEKVRLLAMSPLLSAAQSRALLERIV